jgi:tRNA (Thr-GGU) A37 N-methylase
MDIPISFVVEGDRWLQVQNLEAIDGTPIIDIKPAIERNLL